MLGADLVAPTVSIPFIYLKARGKESMTAKKAKFPSSIATLLKVCNRLFRGFGTVRSLFSSEGKPVKSLDDIVPGSTLYVSSLDPDPRPADTTLASLRSPPRSSEQVYASSSYWKLFGTPTSETDESPVVQVEYSGPRTGDPIVDSFLMGVFSSADEWVQSFLSVTPELEDQQRRAWFQAGQALFVSHSSGSVDGPLTSYDETCSFIREIISKHRFATNGGTTYRMRIGITGPRFSGKSQLLMTFADEIMLEYGISGAWRRTFFVFLNFRVLGPFLSDMHDFYTSFVDVTLQNLMWQRPALKPFHPGLRKFLLSVTSLKSCPKIPVNSKFYQDNFAMAQSLQKTADRLYELFNDSTATGEWISTVFLLPSLVSAAAGFSQVFYFVDNLEFADLDLTAAPPFAECAESCFVAERLKLALSRGNFIVTSENQDRLPELLLPLEAGGCNLMADVDIISPTGIVQIEDDRMIKFDIQDEAIPFHLTAGHCCGIPAFVALWTDLNAAFDEYDAANAEEKDEFLTLLTAQAQHVIGVLFQLPDNAAPLFVTAVRR
jgi:hypothetical protein